MLTEFQIQRKNEEYERLNKIILSQNLKELLVENEYLVELDKLNDYFKESLKYRLNNILKEKSIRKNNYSIEINDEMLRKIRENLTFKHKDKFIIRNIFEEYSQFAKKSEEILNMIYFWDGIFSHLDFFSRNNLIYNLFSKEEIDKNQFENNLKEIFFEYKILNIDDLYLDGDLLKSNNILHDSSVEQNQILFDLNLLQKNFRGKDAKRRPIKKLNAKYFSYIPLECNGFCGKIINYVKKNFFQHLFNDSFKNSQNLEEYGVFKNFNINDFKELELIIYKNCIFAHNSTEINYHFLKFKTKICNVSRCKKPNCENFHAEISLNESLNLLYSKRLNNISQIEEYFTKYLQINSRSKASSYRELNLNNLQDTDIQSNNSLMITPTNINYSNWENIIENIKTEACPLKSMCLDIKNCFKFHSILEKRRDPKIFFIKNNTPCKNVFKGGKWENPKNCQMGDLCEFFHTKYELMFDRRNFRRLYECHLEKRLGRCPYFDVCAYKHNIDVNLNEIFLPRKKLNILTKNHELYLELKAKFNSLKHELNDEKFCLNCTKCKKFLKSRIVILKCMHAYCSDCFTCVEKHNDCIFDCLKNRASKTKIKINYDYFTKNLDDNLTGREDLISKRTTLNISDKPIKNPGNFSIYYNENNKEKDENFENSFNPDKLCESMNLSKENSLQNHENDDMSHNFKDDDLLKDYEIID